MAYILSLAIQLKQGYNVNNLTLKSGDEFKQINFDLIVALPELFKKEYSNYTFTRNRLSLLVIGIGTHLAADLWAHMGIIESIDALKRDDFSANAWNQLKRDIANKNLCYLDLSYYNEKDNYSYLHGKYAEGASDNFTSYVQKRYDQAQRAVNKVIKFYKANKLMYTGSYILAENTTNRVATSAEKNYLLKMKCSQHSLNLKSNTVKKNGKDENFTVGRYSCANCAAESYDSCYQIFIGNTGTLRLGYMKLSGQ